MTTTKNDKHSGHQTPDPHAPAIGQGSAAGTGSGPVTESGEPFHLAKVGSKDYVAGQPVDEAELAKVDAEHDKLVSAAKEAKDKAAAASKAQQDQAAADQKQHEQANQAPHHQKG